MAHQSVDDAEWKYYKKFYASFFVGQHMKPERYIQSFYIVSGYIGVLNLYGTFR